MAMRRFAAVLTTSIPALAASILAAHAPPAQAQAPEPARPPDQESAGGLAEIVVTAQKRAENVQDVPISIVTLDAGTLEKRNVASLSDLNDGSVPGLNLAPYPGSADFTFPTFRGITTNTAFISAPNPIAVHVNGVFLSQLVGLGNPAADLERVEVLKGPQGVLAGRNATGGAINVYTAKPRLGELTFKQQLTAASRQQYQARTVLNVPLGDKAAARLSYLHASQGDEGVENSAPGGVKFGERDGNAARLDLRWVPTDAVTVDYGFDYSLSKGYDTPSQCLYPAPLVTAVSDPRVTAFQAGCTPTRQKKLYWPYQWPKNRNEVQGHTLTVEWQASDAFLLRSITGYRKVDTRNNYNYGAYTTGAVVRSDSAPLLVPGTPFDGQAHPVLLYNEALSEELNFLGELRSNLRYTAGVYVSSEDGHQHSGPNVGMYMPGAAQGADFVFMDQKGLYSAKNDSWAVFGQMSWRPEFLEEKLEVVPGLRYTEDHRKAVGYNKGWTTGYVVGPTGVGTGVLYAAVPLAPPGTLGFDGAVGDRTFSKMTPALSLNYHWSPDVMTYAKYAVAYTSGGFDPVSGGGTAELFSKGFEPETIKSIELGLKGEFLDRRLRTNLAVFRSKFTNEQKSVAQTTGGWKTVNVGGSTYQGFELEVTAALVEGLTLDLNFAALSHDYDKWIDPVTHADVTNERKLIVPKDDFSASLDYRFPGFGLPGELSATLTYAHRGETSTPLNLTTPNVRLYSTTPAFGLVNARLALANIKVGPSEHGGLTVALWGRNLTNEDYLTLAYQGWVTAGSGSWGEPRSYGLDLTYRFD